MSDEGNPYLEDEEDVIVSKAPSTSSTPNVTADGEEEVLPEDRFHIKMPPNVNKYTGLPEPTDDSEIPDGPLKTHTQRIRDEATDLPEDRFHKKDAQSSFIINQREQAVKDKWKKYEEEKKQRASDPNVEYIDVDDFKPGGKYGPSKDAGKHEAKAAQLLDAGGESSGGSQSFGEQPRKGSLDSHALEKAASVVMETSSSVIPLSSNLWTELLD